MLFLQTRSRTAEFCGNEGFCRLTTILKTELTSGEGWPAVQVFHVYLGYYGKAL